jgi:type II secretion system protein L
MRIVGLDIGEGEVRIARAERRLGAVRVTALERRSFRTADELQTRLAEVARSRPDSVVLAYPLADATHRFLALPFRDRRRLVRTAPLELAGQLALEQDGLAIACERLATDARGSRVLAVAVRHDALDTQCALLATVGLAHARVELGPLAVCHLLPRSADDIIVVADGRRSALVVVGGGQLTALRALSSPADDNRALAAEIRWSLRALGTEAARTVVVGADASSALCSALSQATGGTALRLTDATPIGLPGDPADVSACAVAAGLVAGTGRSRARIVLARGRSEAGSLRRSAALAVVALALGAVDVGLARHHLARRDAALVAAIDREAAAALPGVRIVAPRAQLDAAADAARRRSADVAGRPGALDVLREVSGRVPAGVRLDLDELSLDGDALVLHGRCDGFAAVDALRNALAGSPILTDVTAEETRATVDGRHVEFRLRAARRSGTGAMS